MLPESLIEKFLKLPQSRPRKLGGWRGKPQLKLQTCLSQNDIFEYGSQV